MNFVHLSIRNLKDLADVALAVVLMGLGAAGIIDGAKKYDSVMNKNSQP